MKRFLLMALLLALLGGSNVWARLVPDTDKYPIKELKDGDRFFIKGVYKAGTAAELLDTPRWLGVQNPKFTDEDFLVSRELAEYVGDAFVFEAEIAEGQLIDEEYQGFYLKNVLTGKWLKMESDNNPSLIVLTDNKEDASIWAFAHILDRLPTLTVIDEEEPVLHMMTTTSDGETVRFYNNNYNYNSSYQAYEARVASFTDGTTWMTLIPAKEETDEKAAALSELMEIYQIADRFYPLAVGDGPGFFGTDFSNGFNTTFEESNADYIIATYGYTADKLNEAAENLKPYMVTLFKGAEGPEDGGYYYMVNAYDNWVEPEKERAAFANNTQGFWGVLEPENAAFIWQFKSLGNGTYTVRNLMTNTYLVSAVRSGAVTLGEQDDVPVTCRLLGPGQYNIYLAPGNNSLHPMGHNSGASFENTLCDFPGGLNSQSAWYIRPVADDIVQALLEEAARQQEAIRVQKPLLEHINDFGNKLKPAFEYQIPATAKDITPTSAFDFYSNGAMLGGAPEEERHGYSWGTDGQGYGALIDNDIDTWFHTYYGGGTNGSAVQWSAYADDGRPAEWATPTSLHNLSMKLAEPASKVAFQVAARHSTTYNSPTKIDVDVSHDGKQWTTISYGFDFFNATTDAEVPFIMGTFDLGDTYEYVRFGNYKSDRSGARFFVFSELKVYDGAELVPTCQAATMDQAVLKSFLAAYSEANKYADKVTGDDIEAITTADANLVSAYRDVMGVYADPDSLTATLAIAKPIIANFKVADDHLGAYRSGTDITPLQTAYEDATALLENGYFTQEAVDEADATLKSELAALKENIVMPEEGKWYQFVFASEDEWNTYNFNDGSSLYDRVATYAYGPIKDEEGNITGVEQYVDVSEVRPNTGFYSVPIGELAVPELSYFRFVPIGDDCYLVQNKGTGLYIPYRGGRSQGLNGSLIPAIIKVNPVGAGFCTLDNYNYFTGQPHSELQTLHFCNPQQSYQIVTWWEHTLGNKSSIKVIAVDEDDQTVGPLYVDTEEDMLYPMAFINDVTEIDGGVLYGVYGQCTEDEQQYVALEEKTSLEAGEPGLVLAQGDVVAIYFGDENTKEGKTVNGLCGVLQTDTLKASQNVAVYNYDLETELPHTWRIVEEQTLVNPNNAYLKLNGGIPTIAYDEIEMAMLVVGSATANPADVNGDTKVNTADVVAVYSFIEKGSESGFVRESCDVNGDGNVNTADVVAIYTAIIGSSGSSSPRWMQRILND